MDIEKITTTCCIAGGGPAGIMLGFLLARAGIETIVIEKWPDFFRDFRGDTIHPSTMEILNELGLLQDFLSLPHDETYQLEALIGTNKVVIADFSKLKVQCPFIAFIPQWDFLNFIAKHAKQYPHFHLMMNTEVTDIIQDQNKVIGLRAKSKDTQFDIYAELVVAADGRHSTVRGKSLLLPQTLSAPMDVLWFKLRRETTDPKQSLGRIDAGKILVMLERGDYWQCGFLIRKNQYDQYREAGIKEFHRHLEELLPNMHERIEEITDWEQIKLLQVTVDRLSQWYKPGLLCIGDAAHAMSPIGGVGINLAIQDAVASANILIPAFQKNEYSEVCLQAIQKRREFPTRFIQALQVFIQNRVIDRTLGNTKQIKLPLVFKLLQKFPLLRRIPAYLVGIGIRAEHINE